MGIILYILSQALKWILTFMFGLATILYFLVTLRWLEGLKAIDDYYYTLAFAQDQYGNVKFAVWLNMLMAKKYDNPYFYGDVDDTISYPTAMNYYKNKPRGLLKFVGNVLDKAEDNHMTKAITSKILRDVEAFERLKVSGILDTDLKVVVGDKDYLKYIDEVTNIEFKAN